MQEANHAAFVVAQHRRAAPASQVRLYVEVDLDAIGRHRRHGSKQGVLVVGSFARGDLCRQPEHLHALAHARCPGVGLKHAHSMGCRIERKDEDVVAERGPGGEIRPPRRYQEPARDRDGLLRAPEAELDLLGLCEVIQIERVGRGDGCNAHLVPHRDEKRRPRRL